MGLFDGTPLERPVRCDRCGKPVAGNNATGVADVCTCPPPDTPASKQRLTVRTAKRANGKVVTEIAGFNCSEDQLKSVLVELKNRCGAGGSIDGMKIAIQGAQIERVRRCLADLGYSQR